MIVQKYIYIYIYLFLSFLFEELTNVFNFKLVLLFDVRFIVHFRFRYYKSLPPISKAFGTLCLLMTTAYQFKLYDLQNIALIYKPVFTHFQVHL